MSRRAFYAFASILVLGGSLFAREVRPKAVELYKHPVLNPTVLKWKTALEAVPPDGVAANQARAVMDRMPILSAPHLVFLISSSENAVVRTVSMEALGAMADSNPVLIPLLDQLVSVDDFVVQTDVIKALDKYQKSNKWSLSQLTAEPLVRTLVDGRSSAMYDAAKPILQRKQNLSLLLPYFLELLDYQQFTSRIESVQTREARFLGLIEMIGSFGLEARRALPMLEQISTNAGVAQAHRDAAAKAINDIGKPIVEQVDVTEMNDTVITEMAKKHPNARIVDIRQKNGKTTIFLERD